MSEINNYTFEAWEKDGPGWRRRGNAIKVKDMKKVIKTFGDGVEKLQKCETDKAFHALESGVRLQAVQKGFIPLTRSERRDDHKLIQCGSCGWWGSSRLVLQIPNKSAACPVCHGVKLEEFDVSKEIKRLQSMQLKSI